MSSELEKQRNIDQKIEIKLNISDCATYCKNNKLFRIVSLWDQFLLWTFTKCVNISGFYFDKSMCTLLSREMQFLDE